MISRANQAKIHIARQQLGMTDEDYRALLSRVAGVTSSKQLTSRTLGGVLREFERLGFQPKPGNRTRGKPHNFKRMPAMIEKIEAQLADMGLPWSYADAIGKQMWGIERTAWVRDEAKLRSMIAALHQEQKKRDMHARILELLDLLEYTEEQQQSILEGLPAGWERRLPIMEPLWKSLANEFDNRRQA